MIVARFVHLLDRLPGNGMKMMTGIVLIALVLGFEQMGYLDAATAALLLKWLTLWTGVSAGHKLVKMERKLNQ